RRELKRLELLRDAVRQRWVVGIGAAPSGPGAPLLFETERLENAAAPFAREVASPAAGTTSLPMGALFDRSARSLLILGAEGSGKSLAMAQLANDLIDRAESDADEPVPVIVQLSTWSGAAGSAEAFTRWLIGQLRPYQIPPDLGARWLQDERLVILLDG